MWSLCLLVQVDLGQAAGPSAGWCDCCQQDKLTRCAACLCAQVYLAQAAHTTCWGSMDYSQGLRLTGRS